jgi:MFS family permease
MSLEPEATATPPLPPNTKLTRLQTWNVVCLILAFSCVVACLTLIVGTGAVVIQSVGGSTTLAPFTLAIFFLGMSFISLTATHWMFAQWGRQVGLWIGCSIALCGVGLSCFGLTQSSPALVLVSQIFLGAGTGMGMYLRFAAVEVVPPEFHSRAVTWVLCGGCLAAFAGPEAAQATKGVFGDENLTYLGVFVVAGCFYMAQAIFVGLIRFPPTKTNKDAHDSADEESAEQGVEMVQVEPEEADKDDPSKAPANLNASHCNYSSTTHLASKRETATKTDATKELWSILKHSSFLLPLAVSILSWALMAMPMSIFRVVMKEVGYTERQSLTVIEFHFLAMYVPGFWSGSFIKKYGPIRASQVAIGSFLAAIAINLSSQDNNKSTATWYLGLVFLGIGWNFGFSSATVWVTQAYKNALHLKAKVQAANECGMFLMSGGAIFSTGYLYQDVGGGGIPGWRTLNYTLLGLVGLFVLVILVALKLKSKEDIRNLEKMMGNKPTELVALPEQESSHASVS